MTAYARLNKKSTVGSATLRWKCDTWKDGEWHFIVVNWAWPVLSLSVDGNIFVSKSLSGLPAWKDDIPLIYLGSCTGPSTLMDEVMVFNRPLDASEAKLIYDTVKTWSEKKS